VISRGSAVLHLLLFSVIAPPTCAAAVPAAEASRDVHSSAAPERARVTHMDLEWDVRFESRTLEGTATLRLARAAGTAGDELRLDTRALEIRSVEAGGGSASGWGKATWRLGDEAPHLGRPLIVESLPAGAEQVRVTYRTSPEATGLQWLDPAQTAGGRHPFLFSQSQAIHARSWIPCQDSPGIRVTWTAVVRVHAPLRAVMAGEDRSVASEAAGAVRTYRYAMPQAIPPYLLALAVGDVSFAEVGRRTGVWAEPPVTPKAAWEFADMERMLEAAEKLYGAYRWGRYDILVLPPSFPFGGMENPRLTFATPSILAGDRSLVSLVSHELAHSWSGNLVTNATWSDFWLNEGFTVYIEERIQEALYGSERKEMEAMISRQDLEKELADLSDKPGDQVLHIDLSGRDPDDGATNVPYVKGALFLRLLEETWGRERFDPFLRGWFDAHAFSSVTTAQFLGYLDKDLIGRHKPLPGRSVPDVSAWVYKPGLPSDAPQPKSSALVLVDQDVARYASGKAAPSQLETKGWVTQQWVHFLRALPASLSAAQMKDLDEALGFTRSGNSEVLCEWLTLSVRHRYEGAYASLERFMTGIGRRKLVRPLYEELAKTPEGLSRAQEIYTKARPLYHAITRQTIDEILRKASAKS